MQPQPLRPHDSFHRLGYGEGSFACHFGRAPGSRQYGLEYIESAMNGVEEMGKDETP
jgi:hypothetical protein